MGKYMRKARITGDVAVVEVPDQSPLGVRTRAKTLASLQHHQSGDDSGDPSCYLQLRSRRLEKTQLVCSPPLPSRSRESLKGPLRNPKGGTFGTEKGRNCQSEEGDDGVGDNLVDLEPKERETTPCSLISNMESMQTPGSTNRPSVRRITNAGCRSLPSPGDVEEFFAEAEQLHQKLFMEKYNFDPVNDRPLPGRYEWVKLDAF